MEIRVNNLKEIINTFNNLLESYEEVHLNLYNEINNASSYWNDGYAINFFENCNNNKMKITNNIEELRNLKNIYDFIINKYLLLGHNITINLEEKININNYFNKYLNRLNNIINSYNRLDIYELNDIKDIIYNAFDDCDFNIYKDEYRYKIKASIRKAETIYDSLIP